MDNNTNTKDIIALIQKIARSEIDKGLSNTESVYDGVVKATEDGLYYVKIKDMEYDLQPTESNRGVYIRNESGKNLEDGSIVRIYAKGNKMTNAYIGIVFEKNNNNKQTSDNSDSI